jgi:hypothetical protein
MDLQMLQSPLGSGKGPSRATCEGPGGEQAAWSGGGDDALEESPASGLRANAPASCLTVWTELPAQLLLPLRDQAGRDQDQAPDELDVYRSPISHKLAKRQNERRRESQYTHPRKMTGSSLSPSRGV